MKISGLRVLAGMSVNIRDFLDVFVFWGQCPG